MTGSAQRVVSFGSHDHPANRPHGPPNLVTPNLGYSGVSKMRPGRIAAVRCRGVMIPIGIDGIDVLSVSMLLYPPALDSLPPGPHTRKANPVEYTYFRHIEPTVYRYFFAAAYGGCSSEVPAFSTLMILY